MGQKASASGAGGNAAPGAAAAGAEDEEAEFAGDAEKIGFWRGVREGCAARRPCVRARVAVA